MVANNHADKLLFIMLVEKGYYQPLAFRCLERIKTDFCVPLLSLPHRLGVDAAWHHGSAYLTLPESPLYPAGPMKRVGSSVIRVPPRSW